MGKRGPKPTKGAMLGARIAVETRKRLQKAAHSNQRSLSQEAEARLMRSLDEEERTEYWLLQLCAECVRAAEGFTGQSWLTDAFTFELLVGSVAQLLMAFRPTGDARMPETAAPLRGLDEAPPDFKQRMTAAAQTTVAKDWAPHVAGSIVMSLKERGFGRDPREREIFEKAAVYLDGLLTAPILAWGDRK